MGNKTSAEEFAKGYAKFLKESKEFEQEFTEEQRDRIKQTVNVLNQKFMETEFTVPDHIYVDLPLLKDIHLGTLFAMIQHKPNREELYDHIRENLAEYQLRFFDDPIRYFPELGITRKEFEAFKANKKYHDEIYVLSPFTTMIYTLKHNLDQNANHSAVAEKFNKIPIPRDYYLKKGESYVFPKGSYIKDFEDITFYINTYPLDIHKHHRLNLQRIIGDSLGVNVVVLNVDPEKISHKFYLGMDEINTYNLDKLMKNKEVNKDYVDFKWSTKMLFAPLLTNTENEDKLKDGAVLAKEHALATNMFLIFSKFKWLEAARYAVNLAVYETDDTKSDEEIRETPLPSLTE